MSYCLLSLVKTAGEQIHVQLKDDPIIVTKMIASAMMEKPELAAAFITAVLQYANEVKMPIAVFETIAATYRKKHE